MRWVGRQGSGNVSDRRSVGGKIAVGGGIGGVIILLLSVLLGGNPMEMLNVSTQNPVSSEEEDQRSQFVSVVLKDTEDVWNKLFADAGGAYTEPTLVLFSQSDRSGCGFASAATGPFYCPLDNSVYIDLTF